MKYFMVILTILTLVGCGFDEGSEVTVKGELKEITHCNYVRGSTTSMYCVGTVVVEEEEKIWKMRAPIQVGEPVYYTEGTCDGSPCRDQYARGW
jgi:hypothetical protein